MSRAFLGVISLAALLSIPSAAAVQYAVTIDTSSVAGTNGYVDLQLNPGNATSQPVTARITNLSIAGGALTGTAQITGDVTGAPPAPIIMNNSTPLNEDFQPVTFGSSVTFLVELSGPGIDAPNGTATAGTTFSVSLYDQGQNAILTDQVFGSGAAGQIDVNLNGTLTVTAFPNGAAPSVVTFRRVEQMTPVYQVSYASNLDKGDSYVNLTNFGTLNGNDPAGTICVNVYVYDPNEEPVSCCSCPVTPNGLRTLSVQRDLVANPLTASRPSSVVIKLLASTRTNGMCDPATSPTATTLARGMGAWRTTLHQNTATNAYTITEVPFTISQLSDSEFDKLRAVCGFIQTYASGFGLCNSCRAGAQGAIPRQ